MKFAFNTLMAVAMGLALGGTAHAQSSAPNRGYLYFGPGNPPSQNARARATLQPSTTAQPRAVATPGQYAAPERVYGMQAAPSGWGVRPALGSGYPVSLFGHLVQAQGFGQSPSYAPAEVVQGGATPNPPAPGYGPAGPGAPQTGPGAPPAMGGAAPNSAPGGLSPIYAYSGRYPGPYYGGNAPLYYGYGGSCGWGSPYYSTYYTTGCYSANACCRSSRRFCTPFGGMSYGCGSGCYVVTPPPCPTVCDPCNNGVVAPGPVSPPPAGLNPQPLPPNPPPEATDPPQPVEKKVTPAPQASNFPRIPNLPET